MEWVAATVIALFALLGVLLTAITLPGTWLMLLVALACKLVVPESIGWWWLAAAGGLAVIGEIVEFLASAAGAKVGGAGRAGAWGALLGGLGGAILGTVLIPVPVLNTIAGGVVGAGVLATVLERSRGKKSWRDSSRAGAGAAAGKFVSTLLKAAVAGVMAVVLMAGAVWPDAPSHPDAAPDMLDNGAGTYPAGETTTRQGGAAAEPARTPEATDAINNTQAAGNLPHTQPGPPP